MKGNSESGNIRIFLGDMSLLKPIVHLIRLTEPPPGYIWGPRFITDCQFIYMLSGSLHVKLGSEEWTAVKGDCIFLGANSPHKIVVAEDVKTSFYSLHFEWNADSPQPMTLSELRFMLRSCSAAELAKPPAVYSLEAKEYGTLEVPYHFHFPGAEGLFKQLHTEFEERQPCSELIIKGQLCKLLGMMIRSLIANTLLGSSLSKIRPALDAITGSPEKNWTTAQLSELCGYHPNYFSEVFKQATGISPKSFLVAERVKKSKQMLREVHSVEDVAGKMGYTSVHYFCRNFKMITGLTPSQYRKQLSEL
jgi:AraC-like DNA-binding protein